MLQVQAQHLWVPCLPRLLCPHFLSSILAPQQPASGPACCSSINHHREGATSAQPTSSLALNCRPTASLPTKVVKRILDLEFVKISEITINDNLPQRPGHLPAPARLPIVWAEQNYTRVNDGCRMTASSVGKHWHGRI